MRRLRILFLAGRAVAMLALVPVGRFAPEPAAAANPTYKWFPLKSPNVRMGPTWEPGFPTGTHHRYLAIDLMAPKGTPVYASAAGRARIAPWGGSHTSAGLTVEIEHPDGTTSRYMHLSAYSVGTSWTTVAQGQKIGEVGNSGNASGGSPHLHYEELNANGTKRDPGPLCAVQDGQIVTFPQAGGYAGWVDVPSYWLDANPAWPTNEGYLAPSSGPFADVPDNHTFVTAINWMHAEGVSRGTASRCTTRNVYQPLQQVTREVTAAFLSRLSGETVPACPSAPFSDVPADYVFCREIRWSAGHGITVGYDDGTFRPTSGLTRQTMAAFLARYAASGLPDGCTVAPFPDVPVDHPHCREITWLAEAGISEGYGDGSYRPTTAVTRQTMAAFLRRLDRFLS